MAKATRKLKLLSPMSLLRQRMMDPLKAEEPAAQRGSEARARCGNSNGSTTKRMPGYGLMRLQAEDSETVFITSTVSARTTLTAGKTAWDREASPSKR
jgi:hypothetical protein